jgi:hypothetical protein
VALPIDTPAADPYMSSYDPGGLGAWLCLGVGAVIPLSLFAVLVRRRYRREMDHPVAMLHPPAGSSRTLQPIPDFPPPAVSSGVADDSGYVAPAPPKTSRAGLIVSVVTAVLALLCLGAGTTTFFVVRHLAVPRYRTERPVTLPTGDATQTPGDPSTQTPAGTATDPPTQPPTNAFVHDGNLNRLIMNPPAGAGRWPNVKTVETRTVTTAAAELADLGMGAPGSDGEQELLQYGFTDGYLRRWIDKHNTYVTVRIYRFNQSGCGAAYANNKIGGADPAVWGTAQRNIRDVPNAASFVRPKKNGLQEVLVVGGLSDILIVVTTQQRPPATTSIAISVFGAQYKKL